MLDPEVIKVEEQWAQQVVSNAKSILLRNNKNASGRLYNSIRYNVNSSGKISFLYAPEGKWVQQGRRKGARQPPTNPIETWIREKGLKGRDPKTGRYISNKSLAFLIARGISRDGIKPLPFMKMAITDSINKLKNTLGKKILSTEIKRWKNALKQDSRKP
jgi:hypothetical protein